MDPARLTALLAHSVAVIVANQASTGAYLASPSFPVYRYSWLRDGAFIADAMSRAGRVESAEAFFAWCDRVVVARRDRIASLIARGAVGESIPATDFLHTRFTVDGDDGDEEWEEFQLDGYGAWVWALVEHTRRHGRPIASLEGARLSMHYALAFWDHPNYDWWEEHGDQRHLSTLASLYGGAAALASVPEVPAEEREALQAAMDRIRTCVVDAARPIGSLPKWLGNDAVDASLLAVSTPFGLLAPDDPLMLRTTTRIEQELVHDGGVHRYARDVYFGGGEWVLLAGFLGWHQHRMGRRDAALASLAWMAAQATPDLDLPEQVPTHLLFPDRYAGWVELRGPIATPLLWSHAMLLILADELGLLAEALR